MEAKFFTDGKQIFKVCKTVVVLQNLETAEKVEVKFSDDGTLKDFRPVNLGDDKTQTPAVPPAKRKSKTKSNTSKFWGVSTDYKGKFRTQAYFNGKNHYGGTFDTEEEAAKKADEMLVAAGLKKKNFA